MATNNAQAGFGASALGAFTIARVANSSISENIGFGLKNYCGATFLSLGNNFVEDFQGSGAEVV